MGVFKNEVGRPSNETIKKRNIRKGIIITLVAAASCYLLVFIINLIFGLLGIGMSKSVYFILSFIQFKLPIYIIIVGLMILIIRLFIKKFKRMKKELLIKNTLKIMFLLVLIIIIFLLSNKMYTYTDNLGSGFTSKIRINKITKVLYGKFYIDCKNKNCIPEYYKYSLKLTNKEYKNIKRLWKDKHNLSLALFYLRDKDETHYKSYNDYKDEVAELADIEHYKAMDSNSDGKVTSREFADQFMIDILNEKNE